MAGKLTVEVHFDPESIRQHWDGCEPNPIEGLTDEQLTMIGEAAAEAMQYDDILWNLFDEVLAGEVANLKDELKR